MTAHDDLQALQKAVTGLEYPSESDHPFDVFLWTPRGPSSSAAGQVALHAKGRRIEEVSVQQFFSELQDSEDAARFRDLQRVLESRLNSLKIFRAGAGDTSVDIYLLGQTPAGEWAGVHTLSIET